jgi:hypothetical protein
MGKKTCIFSVFGQIESVVADAMAEEGLAHRIDRKHIPASVRWNKEGALAHCALVLTPEMELVFDERVRSLRA